MLSIRRKLKKSLFVEDKNLNTRAIACRFLLMSCHGVKTKRPIASRRPRAVMHVDQADYIGEILRRECSQIKPRMYANGQYRGYDEIVSFIEGKHARSVQTHFDAECSTRKEGRYAPLPRTSFDLVGKWRSPVARGKSRIPRSKVRILPSQPVSRMGPARNEFWPPSAHVGRRCVLFHPERNSVRDSCPEMFLRGVKRRVYLALPSPV